MRSLEDHGALTDPHAFSDGDVARRVHPRPTGDINDGMHVADRDIDFGSEQAAGANLDPSRLVQQQSHQSVEAGIGTDDDLGILLRMDEERPEYAVAADDDLAARAKRNTRVVG